MSQCIGFPEIYSVLVDRHWEIMPGIPEGYADILRRLTLDYEPGSAVFMCSFFLRPEEREWYY
jgi:hypothetical protein